MKMNLDRRTYGLSKNGSEDSRLHSAARRLRRRHGFGSTRAQKDREAADTYAFLLWQL
jgi:hypothetical protein